MMPNLTVAHRAEPADRDMSTAIPSCLFLITYATDNSRIIIGDFPIGPRFPNVHHNRLP